MTLLERSHTPGNQPNTTHGPHEPLPFSDYDSPETPSLLSESHTDRDFMPEYGTDADTNIARLAWQSVAKQLPQR